MREPTNNLNTLDLIITMKKESLTQGNVYIITYKSFSRIFVWCKLKIIIPNHDYFIRLSFAMITNITSTFSCYWPYKLLKQKRKLLFFLNLTDRQSELKRSFATENRALPEITVYLGTLMGTFVIVWYLRGLVK